MSCKHGNYEGINGRDCELCDAEDEIWKLCAAKDVEIADLKAAYESLFKENAARRAAALATQPAESKACAAVGVEAAGLRHAAELGLAALTCGGGSEECDKCAINALRTALASPAPSVGEPVADPLQGAADWLKSGLVDVTVADIQSRLLIGYNRARRLFDGATPPAAPAATEAPSKPFAYYIHIAAEQRGEFVHDLDEALDDLTNCECKITELFDHATPAPAVGASDWWRKRADEIELQVARSGSTEAMRCFTDMRTLLQSALAAVGASVQPVIVEPGNVAANHRFDLEYALRVLGNAQDLLPKEDGAQGEIAAAIKGLQYIVTRIQPVQPVLASLSERIAELVDQHGSLRAAARVLECDAGYLSRLQSGEKSDPGDTLLRRMGLRQVTAFERIKP